MICINWVSVTKAVGFYFGGRKGSSKAKKSDQSGRPVGESRLVALEILAQVEDLNSPTVNVTDT